MSRSPQNHPEWKRWSLLALHARLARLEAAVDECVRASDDPAYHRDWEYLVYPSEVARLYCVPAYLRLEYEETAEYCCQREAQELADLRAAAKFNLADYLSDLNSAWSRVEGWL
ncbi:MAG: hypothetical protein NTV51_10595 [Verrucomicrobia bacterium]|nr:hypothetical protein [Verrucomicrobiota bacterium]